MKHHCTCKHEYQDKKHGKGVRVMNKAASKTGSTLLRCTVCLATYEVSTK